MLAAAAAWLALSPHGAGKPPAERGDVLFVTNRHLVETGPPAGRFDGRRGALRHGRCTVGYRPIPLTGDVADSVDFFVPTEFRQVESVALLDREAFIDAIADRDDGAVALYVHGYAYGFPRTCRVGAELQRMVGDDATIVMFSWPSDGNPADYVADRADVDERHPLLAADQLLQLRTVGLDQVGPRPDSGGEGGEGDQSELYRILDPVKQRFQDHLDEEQQAAVRSDLNEFVRLYAFLSQIITFSDPELERLYLFSRYLKRVLPVPPNEMPKGIQEQIDMESYGIRETASGSFTPERGTGGELDPRGAKDPRGASEHEKERLSAIIQELNDRFGAGLTEKDRISLEHLESQLTGDPSLQAAARSNTRENVRLTFEQRAKDQLQDMASSNFQLYKRIADDRAFGKALLDFLFEGFWRGRENDQAG